ncbi:MAG: Rpn family recombination-promoting nuclease/putative transposase, partial [Desulfitobacteriaceae bacterium]
DELAAVREAELRLKEAIQVGDQKAREAERIGEAKGKAEVAKNLLNMGVEISKVAQATGLSEEEVKRLNDK